MSLLDDIWNKLTDFITWVDNQFNYVYDRVDYLLCDIWIAIGDIEDSICSRIDVLLSDIWAAIGDIEDGICSRIDVLLCDIWTAISDIEDRICSRIDVLLSDIGTVIDDIENRITVLDTLDDIIIDKIEGYKDNIIIWIEDKLLDILWNVGQKEV